MSTVYGNAYLVIAANASASPSAGIFASRRPTAHCDFTSNDKVYAISIKRRIDYRMWRIADDSDFASRPLQGSAWAFQERLLARRVVHFTPTELVWECNSCCRCECSGMDWPEGSHSGYEAAKSMKSDLVEKLSLQAKSTDGQVGKAVWLSVVSQYTAKALTVSSDRLQALSGLARLVASASKEEDKYLAGMWKSQLPGSLDWVVTDTNPVGDNRAPSWSWASLDGQVELAARAGAHLVELVDVSCTTEGSDPYGAVLDGYIILKGEFGPARYTLQDDGEHDHKGRTYVEDELWALKLNMSDWNIWHSLLLRKSQRVPGAWERVGIGVEGDGVFAGKGKSVVKIV